MILLLSATELSVANRVSASEVNPPLPVTLTRVELGFRIQSMVFLNVAALDASIQTSPHLALGVTSGALLVIDPSTCKGPFDPSCSNPHYLGMALPFLEARFDASPYVSPYARIKAGVAFGPGASSQKRNAGIEALPWWGVEAGIVIHGVGSGWVGRLFLCDDWIVFPTVGAQLGWRF